MSFARPRDGIPAVPAHLKAAIPESDDTADLNGVLLKMGIFTLAMVILPIGSYYVSRDYYFGTNLTGAGITAATMANVVLFTFVWYAMREDYADTEKEKAKKKAEIKTQ